MEMNYMYFWKGSDTKWINEWIMNYNNSFIEITLFLLLYLTLFFLNAKKKDAGLM